MSTWPVNPSWTNPTTINSGNQYNAADGVTANDINTIINDLRYLYTHSAPVIQPLSVTPSTSAQTITAPTGVNGYSPISVAAVTSSIDANIVAGNIKSGVTILGVTGNLTPGITPTGNINITTMQQIDVTDYATAQVVDADIVAGNIKSGVNILGVVGTYSGTSYDTWQGGSY